MKQKPLLIVTIVVFLFLLLGASAFALKSYNDSKAKKSQNALEMLKAPVEEKQEENVQTNTSTPEKMKGSIFDIFNKGGNVVCTFGSNDSTTQMDGTIYISGNKMKGTFNMDVSGSPVASNVLSDGEFMYMWSGLLPQGVKMKLDDVEAQAGGAQNASKLSPEAEKRLKDFQQDLEYSCESWNVASGKFVVPKNINFTDFSLLNPGGIIEKAQEVSDDLKEKSGSNMCGSCALIPDPEAKAASMTNFKCN